MAKKPPVIRDNTPAEEAEIQRQISGDPDTWEASADAKTVRRGRPPGQTKKLTTLRVDLDVLEALKKPDPKGWQTRANADLRKGLGL